MSESVEGVIGGTGESGRVARRPCIVMTGGEPAFAQRVDSALGMPSLRLRADEIESRASSLDEQMAPEGVVWIHMVPGVTDPAPHNHDAPVFEEAALLERSVGAARAFADRTRIPLTFVAILPELGLFTAAQRRRCDSGLSDDGVASSHRDWPMEQCRRSNSRCDPCRAGGPCSGISPTH